MQEYTEFYTREEVNEWINLLYSKEQWMSLNINNNRSLMLYKGNLSEVMNKCIRQNNYNGELWPTIQALQQFLNSFEIPKNIIVTRYVCYKEYDILCRKTMFKKKYNYPGFLSTTLLEKEYSMQEIKSWRIPVKIYIPRGTKGAYIPEVNPHMPEFEILLPHHLNIIRIKRGVFKVENI